MATTDTLVTRLAAYRASTRDGDFDLDCIRRCGARSITAAEYDAAELAAPAYNRMSAWGLLSPCRTEYIEAQPEVLCRVVAADRPILHYACPACGCGNTIQAIALVLGSDASFRESGASGGVENLIAAAETVIRDADAAARMNDTTMRARDSRGEELVVRLVRSGERYGRCRCILHDEEDPIVEIYADGPREKGQLDTRLYGDRAGYYYASALCEGTGGLCVYRNTLGSLEVDAAEMGAMRAFIRGAAEGKAA